MSMFLNRICPITPPRLSTWLALACFHAGLLASSHADVVAYWNFNSLSISSSAAPGAGGVPLTLDANGGNGTLSLAGWTGLVDDFGGTSIGAVSPDPAGVSLSLLSGGPTAGPFPGNDGFIDFAVSFEGFIDPVINFATRGTSSGFDTGTWSFSIGGAPFVGVPDVNTATRLSDYAIATVDLSSFPELDGAADVILRYTLSGATSSTGNNRIDNFVIEATLDGADTFPPVVNSFSPANNATGFDGTGYSRLSINFNELIALGLGVIELRKTSTDQLVESFDVSDFDRVDLNGPVLALVLANPLEDSTSYYVKVPATAVLDIAEPPNAYPGITDKTTWTFTTAPPPSPPTVAINKYLNGTSSSFDLIELLVIGNGTPGTTVDLTGMIIKDFTSDASADGGGKYQFSPDPIWAAVPVGTLIVLENNNSATDTDSADFTMRVGLTNTVYFSSLSSPSTIDIANNEMVMIKSAGSPAGGTEGGIHALSGGTPGSFFRLFPGAKVAASGGAAGVIVTNPTSTIADYLEGTLAEGGVALTPESFGTFNNPENRIYVLSLRGVNSLDGDGIASIANTTAGSPVVGSSVFLRGLSGQSAAVTVKSSGPSATLATVTLTVPTPFGSPGSVTLSGAGAAGASHATSGQVITVSGATVTDTAPLIVTIDGLTSPTPSLVTDNGNHAFIVATAGSGGTPVEIDFPAVAHVTVPIEALRDVTERGVAVDLGAMVAVDGVVTEPDFGPGGANYSGFIQDSTAGINIYAAIFNPGLIADHRFVVLGTVVQFSGLTEVVPSSLASVFDLGPATPPTPKVLTLAELLESAEAYEGSLVTVENLIYVSGAWSPGSTVVMRDGASTNIDLRIQAGSEVTGNPGFAAVTVTGILGQFDSSNPFTTGYQLMPRGQSDLTEGTVTVSDYETWALATGATGGGAGDSDLDGLDNAFEYAFGLNPVSASSVNPITTPLSPATAKFTYTRRTATLTGLTYKVFTSSTLKADSWIEDAAAVQTVLSTAGEVQTVEVTLSATKPLADPALFIRVVAD